MSGEPGAEDRASDGPESRAGPTVTNPDPINPPVTSGLSKAVEEVMFSDIGLTTLLNRLKQSIASARDFAQFLKKRSSLEEDAAAGLKRLAKSHLENARKSDVKAGSYGSQLADVMRVQERMADNGMQFALSLHQMHEDLETLSNNIERGRKQWKHDGMDAEKRASDAEQAMLKAKARYDSLADDYDRARTSEVKGSRRIGLKGPRSGEQYEANLKSKLETADADYQEKVRLAKAQRETLISDARPKAMRALKELNNECDSALTLQLQKFATFNEKLLLGNGLVISPLSDNDGPLSQRSLRDIIADIDNDRDFNNYVAGHVGKITVPLEIKYEQNPACLPKQQDAVAPAFQANPPQQATSFSTAPMLTVNTSTQPLTTNNGPSSTQPGSQGQYRAYSPQANNYQPQFPPPQAQPDYKSAAYRQQTSSPYGSHPSNNYPAPPYSHPPYPSEQRAAGPPNGGSTFQQTTGTIPIQPSPQNNINHSAINSAATGAPASLPPQPVFGVSLETLFVRDQSVPTIVLQCMRAVELFGLDVEGIYRLSGTATQVSALRQAFDTLPPTAPQLDFRNPANFHHDVNSVASLLKQFFRDLPDPLFSRSRYNDFIQAAKLEDAKVRCDAMHQIINDLPDPNYATLRAVVLHLWNVLRNEAKNRMGSANLAVCWAPSLMGAHTGTNFSDAGLQARVVDSILSNATVIFDED